MIIKFCFIRRAVVNNFINHPKDGNVAIANARFLEFVLNHEDTCVYESQKKPSCARGNEPKASC